VQSSQLAGFDCLIQEIEKVGTVVKINAGPQSAFFLADRQLPNRFVAPCRFGADSKLNSLFDKPR
jgi:hypothetical protein